MKTKLEKIAATVTGNESATVEYVNEEWLRENLSVNEGGSHAANMRESGYAVVIRRNDGLFLGLQGVDEKTAEPIFLAGSRSSKHLTRLHDEMLPLFSAEHQAQWADMVEKGWV